MAHPTLSFLRILDPAPNAKFNFETFSDMPRGASKPQSDSLVKRFPNLTIAEVEELLPRFAEFNQKGAGIFVAVNQFNGQRKKANLNRVRGVHADFDGVDQDTLDQVRATLPPTIEVQSSGPRNWHFYWLLADGESLDVVQAENINRQLVQLGADPAAVDVTRLLRLPGFRHMKKREVT